MIVDCAVYRDGRRAEEPAGLAEALRTARGFGGSFLWIGLHEPTGEELARLSQEFGLHPLAVEDVLSARQRPKLELYRDSLFLVLKPVVYDSPPGRVRTGELMLLVGDSFVISVRHGDVNPLDGVRERLEHRPELLRHGPAAVMYAVSDAVVDQYLEVAARLQADLGELEEAVFTPDGRAGGDTAGRVYAFKRQVLRFRRATGPLTDPVERLAGTRMPFVPEGSRPFFRDVADHLTRAGDQVEALDRLLSDILSAYLAQVGVRQNDDMRKISAWAAMAAVPTMIAGVYGMNFAHMPELHHPLGYPAVLALTAAASLGLYRFFRRRGWL
ncbi:magnesium and cobalt transport protein CorA [Streptomyces sp. URMC 125]|uniref:magnesium and cobalt transport protein CorA n=1 Tax=Streptomyces sp. URMC 125 TaxID=3423419 RepID=UPI003F1DB1E0